MPQPAALAGIFLVRYGFCAVPRFFWDYNATRTRVTGKCSLINIITNNITKQFHIDFFLQTTTQYLLYVIA